MFLMKASIKLKNNQHRISKQVKHLIANIYLEAMLFLRLG